ncbi:tRNA-splicing endonuclease subunit Sen15 isoform X1 [Microcaecilia unicolor]|uniref:tRNA-splicing endonuclease subunit Sen15 isoform X1 n=1 Tax=Microcaecilia unicolor TaxID=1415580 RepID=A0A6P7YH51_9AMPH|nr:tRNA-splicing endonuclease subunit Sen15 isoform X1 [Microcaecilia unicolor]
MSLKLLEMMALDVADTTQVYAAFLVYLDLLEARNWWEVTCRGIAELQMICLYGREREAQNSQVVVPTPVSVSYSQERIRKIMEVACETENKQNTPMAVILAIVESDSTIVYYKLTDGFVVPELPDCVQDMDNKQWRKKRRKFLK